MTIKAARERKGWTPDELAEHAGVHRATVYRLESGDITNPSSATVDKLELALRLKRGTLTFGQVADEAQAS